MSENEDGAGGERVETGGRETEEEIIKRFEDLVAKYGKKQNLQMFEHFHSPGFNVKHLPNVTDNIEYVLDGNRVKVRCRCGASLDLTDYTKLDNV